MFASCYYRNTIIKREKETVAVGTLARTPILQTRQNWHNHLPNKTTEVSYFSEWIVALNVLLECIILSLSHGIAAGETESSCSTVKRLRQ
jgi:hypothetical protein